MWYLRGWFSSGIRIRNSQTSENIFPEQYASHDDKEFQNQHWYTQAAFHKYGPDRNLIKCLVEVDQNHEDKIWLPLELFLELLDRQRDSFVGTKFLQSAEAAIIQNNTDMMEAFWCRLICQWYQPVDGVRLSVSQLVERMTELHNHLSQFCRPGSLKTPSVPFIRHPYAQLKCIVAMLIAGCSCTHWQKVALVSNDRYRVLILRQCLETFKILTKMDSVY